MALLRNIASGLRALLRKKRVEGELDEEVRGFLEMAAEEKMKEGVGRKDALCAVRLEQGTREITKEAVRAASWETFLETCWQDLRFGLSMLRRSPGFTVVAVLTVALGVGANTAIFSVFDVPLLRDLTVADPHSLVVRHWQARKAPGHLSYSQDGDCDTRFEDNSVSYGCSVSQPLFEGLRDARLFANIGAFASVERLDLSAAGRVASPVDGAKSVSGNYFQTLGVHAALGRLIGPEEDTPSAPAVLVLNYLYWKTYFGADPSIVGKRVLLNRVPFAVVGVAGPR